MAHKVLIFSLSYFPLGGGAEMAIKEITNRISDIEFDLVTLRFDKSHPKFERIGNVNVYRIGGGIGYLSKILFVPQAAFFALRRKYDLYWVMMTYMLFPIVVARIFGDRTAYVLTLQDGDPFEFVFKRKRIRIFHLFLKYGFRHASVIQAISRFLAEWPKKIGYKGNVEVIPNGVDIEKFKNQKSKIKIGDTVTLITASRLVEKNAVGDIIEAVKFMPENVHLQILGTGPLEESLKFKVKSLKLENRIEFFGHIDNDKLPNYLHDADIFIRPSLSEGQGISFIEAMAAGLSVIATHVGGIPDFLKNEETGLFCEPRNPESIAEQVKKLISDKLLRERIVENALKMVKAKYDWSLIVEEMKEKVFML